MFRHKPQPFLFYRFFGTIDLCSVLNADITLANTYLLNERMVVAKQN